MLLFKKSLVLSIVFAILTPSLAKADFTGDFAPQNWIYYETNATANGPKNSLTSSTLQIESADWGSGAVFGTFGQYGIAIPWYLDSIKFDYSYVTNDVDGSSYDMPSYSLNGAKTFLVANNIPKNGTASGSISLDVSSLAGKPLFFTQECSDCVLGSATIRISNFIAKPRNTILNANTLATSSNPTLVRDSSGLTCRAPSFSFKRYGFSNESAAPTTLIYSLIVDGKKASSVSTDNWRTLSRSLFAGFDDSLKGVATDSSAFWATSGLNFTFAQCEVVAFQDNSTALSFSNIVGS